MRDRNKILFAAAATLAGTAALLGDFSGSYLVPLDHKAIQYATMPEKNRVADLQKRIVSGEVKLSYHPDRGYLDSLLEHLKVPASSQVLVFSKTSFQAPRISPRTPRALYHSDDVSVGYVLGGDVLEIAAVDAQLGTVFYTLDQQQSTAPSMERRGDCLQCHAGNATLGVPGLVVRSLHVERSGMPVFRAGSFVTDHRSPLSERWGGWYVTGKHGSQLHMGNVFVEDKDNPEQLDRAKGANVTALDAHFNTNAFLRPGSDIVSLMVLEHSTRMVNLITRVGFEVRMALHDQRALNEMDGSAPDTIRESTARRIKNAADEIVRYMLFADEARLDAPLEGAGEYNKDFMAAGPRDSRGRSLRDLDLETRLFKYPLSFYIYSEAFNALPAPAKDEIYRRLWAVLSGADKSQTFAKLTKADRAAILEILRETKGDLPNSWKSRSSTT